MADVKTKFRTAYNRSSDSVYGSCVKFTAPDKVKKSLSYATDINTIFEQYCKTGRLPLNGRPVLYDENFVNYDSLIDAQKLVEDATLYFNGLPANIKNQYGNSLEKFVLALNKRDPFLIDNGVLNVPVKNGDTSNADTSTPLKSETQVAPDVPVNTAETV